MPKDHQQQCNAKTPSALHMTHQSGITNPLFCRLSVVKIFPFTVEHTKNLTQGALTFQGKEQSLATPPPPQPQKFVERKY